MVKEDAFIDSSDSVINRLGVQSNVKVTNADVIKVMKASGMTYRKVKHIPIGANSVRNLILRQRWLMAVLERDNKHRVYINVDESWLGMCDFRRMKWQSPGTTNSVAALSMAPRVTMMVAVDSLGGVFFALSQSNSNHATFCLFIRQLVIRLDEERPHWRRNTILTLDGAKYHKAGETMELFVNLEIPVAMLGPYR